MKNLKHFDSLIAFFDNIKADNADLTKGVSKTYKQSLNAVINKILR